MKEGRFSDNAKKTIKGPGVNGNRKLIKLLGFFPAAEMGHFYFSANNHEQILDCLTGKGDCRYL